MKQRIRRLSWVQAVAMSLALVAASCRGAPPPLAPPPFDVRTERFLGTSLTGPRPIARSEDAAFDPAFSPELRCRVHWFEEAPEHSLAPLNDRIEQIVDVSNASELMAAAGFTEAAWVGTGVEAKELFESLVAGTERSATLGTVQLALPRGVTFVLRRDRPPGEVSSLRPREGTFDTSIQVAHVVEDGADRLRVALAFDGFLPARGSALEYVLMPRHEVLILKDSPEIGGAPELLLFTPRDFPGGGTFAFLLEAEAPPGANALEEVVAAHRADVARCAEEVVAAAARVEAEASPDPLKGLVLLEQEHRRGALARLAIVNGASACEDFAFAADDATIDRFVEKLAAQREGAPPATDLALELERATLRYLADRMSGTEFPPALAAVALRRAGEAGRFPAALEDSATSARDLADLEQRFVSQNESFLEDRSPSSRSRAFEWLTRRGLAPENYDPLAPHVERKKALRAAEDKEAAAAEAAAAAAGAAAGGGE